MSAIFSPTDFDLLSGHHVCSSWFLELNLPGGWHYLHSGTGRINLGGRLWRGVSDPIAGSLVSVSNISEPRKGVARAVQIVMSGADRQFLQSIHAARGTIEGREANLHFAVSDPETGKIIMGLHQLFPGYISSPEIVSEAIGLRTVAVKIESRWAGMRFDPLGMWSPAGQRKRYPGDLGMDFMGVNISELLRS